MKFPSREQIALLRKQYPVGTRIVLDTMDDCQAPPSGTMGVCQGVDDGGNILMRWSNGCGLSLIPEVDSFRIVEKGSGRDD